MTFERVRRVQPIWLEEILYSQDDSKNNNINKANQFSPLFDAKLMNPPMLDLGFNLNGPKMLNNNSQYFSLTKFINRMLERFTSWFSSYTPTKLNAMAATPSPIQVKLEAAQDDKVEKEKSETEEFCYNADEIKEKWAKSKPHLSDSFYKKVIKISKDLNCNPNELMALMNLESGLDPSQKNKYGGSATGLIQITESTAKGLGTTTEELKAMDAVQQLDYVAKYLKQAKKIAGLKKKDKVDAGTLYAITFLPGRAKKEELTHSGEKYYASNTQKGKKYSVLDVDKDGVISKTDLAQRIYSCMA